MTTPGHHKTAFEFSIFDSRFSIRRCRAKFTTERKLPIENRSEAEGRQSAKSRIENLLLPLFALAFLLLAAVPAHLMAELVWTPQTGWKSEGGILTGLGPEAAREALDMMNKARVHEEEGEDFDAIRLYEQVAKKFSNSIYAPEALFRAATLLFENRRFDKAFNNYQNILSRYPNTTRFDEIIGQQYIIAAAGMNGMRSAIFWIFPGFPDREKAINQFETILFNAPYSDYAPLALMSIAAGHRRLGNNEEALYALDRLINNYGHSVLTPEAYIKIAHTWAALVDGPAYDQGATKQAITYYEDFMILFPNDTHIGAAEKGLSDMKRMMAQSRILIGDFYFRKRANFKAARVFFNEAITIYPDSEIAKVARERLAQVEAAAARAAQPPAKRKPRFFFF